MRPEIAVAFIAQEYKKASSAFPKFNSAHEGWAVLKEEVDELWEAVRLNQKTPDRAERLEEEAIQVGAMAVRFLVDCCSSQDCADLRRKEK